MTPLHQAAREWAEAGFYVFPCKVSGKKPANEHGLLEATRDLDQINRWWSEADYNIGVAPARSGMFVLDQDGPLGADTLAKWTKDHGPLPATLTIRTPRGPSHLHYWFRGDCPNSQGKDQKGRITGLGPKLDTRGEGGYVLVPPSHVRYEDGTEGDYDYETDPDDIADGPSWIATAIRARRTEGAQTAPEDIELDASYNVNRAQAYLSGAIGRGRIPQPGSRDATCFELVCMLRDYGLSQQKTFEMMAEQWLPLDTTPDDDPDQFTEDDLARKIESAYGGNAQNDQGAYAHPDPNKVFAAAISAPDAEKEPTDLRKSPFYFYALDERDQFREPEWLIPALIPKRGSVQIIGPKKSFKTFLSLHMVMGIATGTEVFGHTPQPHRVLYMVGENADTMMLKHTVAWEKQYAASAHTNFRLVRRVPLAARSDDLAAIEGMAKTLRYKPDVIVIDTMTRAMRMLDENSAKDAGLFSEMVEAMQRAFDATVIVVRHTGKDAERGGRGSNVAECDFDTTLMVQRFEKTPYATLRVAEQRNAEELREPFYFEVRKAGPSAVAIPTTAEACKTELRKSDPFAPERVTEALARLGTDVTTHALATELAVTLPTDSEALVAEIIQKTETKLRKLSEKELARYAAGKGSGLRWSLPRGHGDDEVPV